jgi:hypothetical protein
MARVIFCVALVEAMRLRRALRLGMSLTTEDRRRTPPPYPPPLAGEGREGVSVSLRSSAIRPPLSVVD